MTKIKVIKTRTSTEYWIDEALIDAVGKWGAVNTERVDNGAVGTHDGADLELVQPLVKKG